MAAFYLPQYPRPSTIRAKLKATEYAFRCLIIYLPRGPIGNWILGWTTNRVISWKVRTATRRNLCVGAGRLLFSVYRWELSIVYRCICTWAAVHNAAAPSLNCMFLGHACAPLIWCFFISLRIQLLFTF